MLLPALQVSIRPAGAAAGQAVVTNAQDRTFQRNFAGQGVDVDIVVASIRAYIAALNKMRVYLSEEGVAESSEGASEAVSYTHLTLPTTPYV